MAKTKTTEDNMIEQTFENLDSEITATGRSETGMTQEPSANEKKKSNYNLLFIAGGATALALGGYFFLFKEPTPQPRQVTKVEVPQEQVSPPVTPASVASMPENVSPSVAEKFLAGEKVPAVAVAPTVVDPLAQLQQGVTNTPVVPVSVASATVVDPLTQLQQNAGVNSVVTQTTIPTPPPVTVVDPLAQLQQNAANQATTVVVTPGKPVVVDGVAVNLPKNQQGIPVTNGVNGTVSVVNNMGAAPTNQPKTVDTVVSQVATSQNGEVNVLTQQTDDNKKFIGILESINSKFGTVEKIWEEQKVVNTKVDERLTALEKAITGKTVNVVKPTVVKSSVASKKTNVARVSNVKSVAGESNVLIDKSSNKKINVVKSNQSIQESDSPKVEIHSIYGGRIWTKNGDGSLSTFTVGDKLPNGEIIRKIDDENFTVSTDKKTMKY